MDNLEHKKIVLDKKEGCYTCNIDECGDELNKKYITDGDIKNIFGSIQSIQTPLLPFNCKFYHRDISTGREIIIIEFPEQKRELKYRNKSSDVVSRHLVPIPYTYFIIPFNGRYGMNREEMLCVCSDGPLKSLEDQNLYLFPYGNVYSHARICWGTTETGSITQLFQTGTLVNAFLNAIFNGDLYDSTKTDKNLSDLLSELSGKDTFPSKYLYQISNIKEALEKIGFNND